MSERCAIAIAVSLSLLACGGDAAAPDASRVSGQGGSTMIQTVMDRPPAANTLAGRWEGRATIVVQWVKQPELTITLGIDENRRVEGRVGGATLVGGRLRRNRGALGRLLGLNTDYLIEARLFGPIVPDAAIHATRIWIPFDVVEGRLEGGLSTSRKIGGPGRSGLSATNMVLRRS